jgi:hypothetical protein
MMKIKFKVLLAKALHQIKLLPHRPRLLWNKLFIRKDEFHHSLDMDVRAMMKMDDSEQQEYLSDLISRRNDAHYRYLDNDR